MKTIEINEIPKYIEATPVEMNLMFVGDTGIGKTTVIERYCAERDIYLKTLILSHLEASEALGIPVRSEREFGGKKYDVLKSAIPEWVFDLAEHKNSILFLDEFLCAQPSTMNSFLNFLTQKKVEGIDLSHVRIIAATNVGNYTFDPDNNILSRFCWFYAENKSVNDFVKDTRIFNDYKDECDKTGVLFEERSLKPRCHEMLSKISDEYLNDFYTGYTNRIYKIINRNSNVNNIISNYFESVDGNIWTISDENAKNAAALLKAHFPRVRSWEKTFKEFFNVDVDGLVHLKRYMIGE